MPRVALSVLVVALLAAGYAALPAAQDAPAGPQPPAPAYQFREVLLKGDNAVLIRFKPATGEVWMLYDKWKRIAENPKLPPGDYDLIARPVEDSWFVARLDRVSGRVWYLNEKFRWVESEESDEILEPGPKEI